MVTVVCATGGRDFDFLPLTVDYQDRNGANGTIPGGYLKREGRSSERETLVSRLIDRPVHCFQSISAMSFKSSQQRCPTTKTTRRMFWHSVVPLQRVIFPTPMAEAAAVRPCMP